MPIRQKTIEYAFPTTMSVLNSTTLVAPTLWSSSFIPIWIPETGSRQFVSCWLEWYMRDSSALTSGRGSINTARSWTYFSNGSQSLQIITGSLAHLADTGEQQGHRLTHDCTNLFSASFGTNVTQSSMAYSLWYTGSTANLAFLNHCAKLYITYNYDDVQQNRIKTVRIPIEATSSLGTLTQKVEIHPGYRQIPKLDDFCVEANKTFRQIWLQFDGNEYTPGTTDTSFSCSLDNEPSVGIAFFEQANQSAIPLLMIRNTSSMDTSTTHSLFLQKTGSNYFYLAPTLYATYEYNHASSTRILNSVKIPFGTYDNNYGSNASEQSNIPLSFNIQESNPQLTQSAVYFIGFSVSTVPTYYIGTNVKPATAWLSLNTVASFASVPIHRRIDTWGPYGQQFPTMSRGENDLTMYYYYGSPQRAALPTGFVVLNYVSDKHTLGDGVHNHTIQRLLHTSSVFATVGYGKMNDIPLGVTRSLSIPENNYYITAFGYHCIPVSSWTGNRPISYLQPYLKAGDPAYDQSKLGMYDDFTIASITSANTERANYEHTRCDLRSFVRRYPQALYDPKTNRYGMQPFLGRLWVFSDGAYNQTYDCVTYHSIQSQLSGSISNYSGDGSGITVFLKLSGSNLVEQSTSTTIGGNYSFKTYDNTQQYLVQAHQDSTHTGVSWFGTASLIS